MKRGEFLKLTGAAGLAAILPVPSWAFSEKKIKTAHIGVGNMGFSDLEAISSHKDVTVFALCDVDKNYLLQASKAFPEAKIYSDYRLMLSELKNEIGAVIVSTPDHTHAPASLMAMELGIPVYCQKPLAHHVSEVRDMMQLAKEKNLITQMGIQVHSFYDYKLASILIKGGIIGKVSTVIAWSNKNWGYDGAIPDGSDTVPNTLDWNLWQGTAKARPYKKGYYHPANWRKLIDYGCATLGDMGVHIFDTPYNSLDLDVPLTVMNECRMPTNFGHPEKNKVTYTFSQTPYTTKTLTWIWYDGDLPEQRAEIVLPDADKLPEQGAMFVGEKGRLLLPHFMQFPKLIINGKYQKFNASNFDKYGEAGSPTKDYGKESLKHYHEFIDACSGKATCSAPFSYSGKLTETILLGVIAGRFPNKKLHWNKVNAQFEETEANEFLKGTYRKF